MLKLLRKILGVFAWICGLSATILFVVSVRISETDPISDKMWKLCADIGLVAWIAEKSVAVFESRDAKVMIAKLDATKTATEKLVDQHAPRTFGVKEREIFKSNLSKYAGQEAMIFQLGFGDDEGFVFSWRICEVLSECGWNVSVTALPARSEIHLQYGVACWIGEEPTGEQKSALRALMGEISKAKMAGYAEGFINLPGGVIGIAVGPHP